MFVHDSPNKSSNDILLMNSPDLRYNLSDLERTAPNSPRFSLKREDLSVAQMKLLHERERSMLLQYVYCWHNVGISFLKHGYFSEALPCFENAIKIYENLLMYLHLSACKSDYFFCKIMIILEEDNHHELFSSGPQHDPSFSTIKDELLQASLSRRSDKFHSDTNLGLNFFQGALALLVGETNLAYEFLSQTSGLLTGEALAVKVISRLTLPRNW